MNISITFRHMDASSAVKTYAREKVSKLQKFLRQPMTAKVTLSLDKLKHVAETRISSGGQHIEAREQSEDMYASIDKMIDKLERIIRGAKGAKVAKARRSGATLRTGVTPEPERPMAKEAAEPARPAKVAKKAIPSKKTATAKTAPRSEAGARAARASRSATRRGPRT